MICSNFFRSVHGSANDSSSIDYGLLHADVLMLQHNLHAILVVSAAGMLIGITSGVDLGVTILSIRQKMKK